MLVDIRTPFVLTATLVATAGAASLSRDTAVNRVVSYHANARAPEDEVAPERPDTGLALQLPAGAELVVGNYVQTTFSCDDAEHQRYGYYADVDNNCQVFHVCNPVQMPSSNPQHLQQQRDVNVLQYSFYCGNGTVFDQLSMTCAFEDDAIPCGNSPDFYYLNDNLGIEDALLLTDDDVARKVAIIEAARGQQPNQIEISPTRPPMDEMATPAPEESIGSTKAPFRAQTPPFGRRQPPPHAKPHSNQQKTQQQQKSKQTQTHQQQQSKRPGQQPKYASATTVQQATSNSHDSNNLITSVAP